MKKTAFVALLSVIVLAGLAAAGIIRPPFGYHCAPASCCGTAKCRCSSPFGGYCTGSGWGWYGADKKVNTAAQAEEAIKNFYSPQKVKVLLTRLQGGTTFFEAQVRGAGGRLIDTVIVDRRTGRISSIN